MANNFKTCIEKLKSHLRAIVVIVIVIVLFIIGLAAYLIRTVEPTVEPVEQLPAEPVVPKIPTPEEAGAGEIGETKIVDEETGEKRSLITATFPPQIFTTVGTISEIGPGFLTVAGSGSNFVDQTPRTLTVTITDITLIFEANLRFQAAGKDGLKYLKQGDKIIIGSQENIRGKTEFKAAYIKKLEK